MGIKDTGIRISFGKKITIFKLFYFTYGDADYYPYKGGWTEVFAPDLPTAQKIFKAVHPNIMEGIINCADFYTSEEFVKSGMLSNGNRGKYKHELLIAQPDLDADEDYTYKITKILGDTEPEEEEIYEPETM